MKFQKDGISKQIKFAVQTIVLLLMLSSTQGAMAQTNNHITGTLVLPGSMLANGKIDLSVVATINPLTGGSHPQISSVGLVDIEDGQNSTPFDIFVPHDPDPSVTGEQWQIRFICNSNCDGWTHLGYYDAANSLPSNVGATSFAAGTDHTGLIFPVIKADVIRGSISLPNGLLAPAGGVGVSVRMVDSLGAYADPDTVLILENENSADYQLNIDPTMNASTRLLFYDCNSNCDGLLGTGYYVSNSMMTSLFNDASDTPSAAITENIDLTIIPVNTISGTLSLPAGVSVPAQSTITVTIVANPVGVIGGTSSELVTFNPGETSKPYSVEFVGNSGGQWRMTYGCETNCTGIDDGTYNSAATTSNFSDGTDLAAETDHIDIDILMLGLSTISGTVSVPSGLAQGDIGVDVFVSAPNFLFSESQSIVISDQTSSEPYSIEVPGQMVDLTVSLSCTSNCTGFETTESFYNSAGTVVDELNAEKISGGSSQGGINMTLISPVELVGTIGLPSAITASSDIAITLRADLLGDSTDNVTQNVIIAGGTNSIDFRLPISTNGNDDWIISYSCDNDCPDYVNQAFFSDSATVANDDNAREFAGGSDVQNIDFDLLDANTITGQITLPMAAGAVGASYRLSAIDQQTSQPQPTQIIEVTIGQGQTSGTYGLDVPIDADSEWLIGYVCLSDCDTVFEFGFYSDLGVVDSFDNATSLLGNAFPHTNKNIVVPQARLIQGRLSLPSGEQAQNSPIDFSVTATLNDDSNTIFRITPQIDTGSEFVDYTIKVPDDNAVPLLVAYSCNSNCSGYADGFFATAGSVTNANLSLPLSGGDDHAGIDMNVLQANTISGKISLPSGVLAPASGVKVGIDVFDSVNQFSETTSVTIASNQNFVNYTIDMSPDSSSEWTVRYVCIEFCEGVIDSAYYAGANVDVNQVNALSLAGGQNHVDIDLAMILGRSITGRLSVPAELTIPEGGIRVRVSAIDVLDSKTSDTQFTILEPEQNFFDYQFDVEENANSEWVTFYLCDAACDDINDRGYYSLTGTQPEQAAAERLTGGTAHSGIDFSLLSTILISGELSLPHSRIASAPISLEVSAENSESGSRIIVPYTLGLGESAFAYEIPIPAGLNTNWILKYDCTAGCDGYLLSGFYAGANPTVLIEADAVEVPINSVANVLGIDFSMIGQNEVSGQLVLPNALIASGDISFTVKVKDQEMSGLQFEQNVTVADGQSSAGFLIKVPDLAVTGWELSYICNANCAGLTPSGYLAGADSEFLQVDAVALASETDHTGLSFEVVPLVVISGEIRLPDGASTPGIELEIALTDPATRTVLSTEVSIPPGQISATFSFETLPAKDKMWRLGYRCRSNCQSYSLGYYLNNSESTPSRLTSPLFQGDISSTNLVLFLQQAALVSGTISTPNGELAPAAGYEMFVLAFDTTTVAQVQVAVLTGTLNISAGQSSVPYSLRLPKDSSSRWRIRYVCGNCNGYFPEAYYAQASSQLDLVFAESIATTTDLSNIDLNLIKATTISGKVSFIDERTLPLADSMGRVSVVDDNGSSSHSTFITIPAGQSSTTYQLNVRDDPSADWRVNFACDLNSCPGFFEPVFYARNGSVIDAGQADLLAGGRNHSNINLLILDEDAATDDDDGDGFLNGADNCRYVSNGDQADENSNNVGDVCENDNQQLCFPIALGGSKVTLVCL